MEFQGGVGTPFTNNFLERKRKEKTMQEEIFKYKLRLSFDLSKKDKKLNFEFLKANIHDVNFKPMEPGHPDYPGNPDYKDAYVFASGSFFTIELERDDEETIPKGALTIDFTPDTKFSSHLSGVEEVTPLCQDRYRARATDFRKMPVGFLDKHTVNPRTLAKRLMDNGAKMTKTSEVDWWQIKKVFPDKNDAYKLSGKLKNDSGVFEFDPRIIVNGRK
jgi:hypothetical protein